MQAGAESVRIDVLGSGSLRTGSERGPAAGLDRINAVTALGEGLPTPPGRRAQVSPPGGDFRFDRWLERETGRSAFCDRLQAAGGCHGCR